jgi:hypothetical protein
VLDLSNNFISDVADLIKLIVQLPGKNCLKVLKLCRNNLQEAACRQLMTAMMQPAFSVTELYLDGNKIGDGYLLIAHSLIKNTKDNKNKALKVLSFNECSITVT